jgi:sugar phosphate isomerase/epimerase
MAVRIAAHTFIFQQYGLDQTKQTDKIADTIAEAGYDAVEWHHAALVGDDYKNRLKHAQRNSGLELVGVSQSLPLWNQGDYERIMDILDDHAERLSLIDQELTTTLACSGKGASNRNDAQKEHLLQVWTEVSSLFDSLDQKVTYQNNGDLQSDLDNLTENLEEDILVLSPNLHALLSAKIDPIAYIKENGDLVGSLHIRDYHIDGGRTIALGDGDLPFDQLKTVIGEIEFDGDIIVDLILPSGTPPDTPILEILKTSRETISDQLGL